MRAIKWVAVILLILIVVYFLGPHPASPKYAGSLPALPVDIQSLDSFIRLKESAHRIKPDNESRIIWADSARSQTEYAVVYLHGFSASQEEGDPVHTEFARTFGCNLYLPRLASHGLDTTEPLADFTARGAWESALEALAIGKKLGKKVILIGTSTGGTLALKLAAQFPDIAGLLLLSPNIAINDGNAWLLNNPWGLQIAHLVKGKYNTSKDTTAIYKKYWYSKYRMEGAVQLEELLETTMKASLFEKVKQPVLLLYYYKDEDNQDPVVKVSAMKRMFRQLGTPANLKKEIAMPATGDHVIGSYIKSKDVTGVTNACVDFGINVLKLPPPPTGY